MTFRSVTLAALSLMVAVDAAGLGAQDSKSQAPLLVSTSWLSNHLGDKNLVLLHVGDKKDYDAQHIPGARYITAADLAVADSVRGLGLEMPPSAMLHDRLAGLGISNKSRVVVYYANEWVTVATRILFTLNYAGLGDNASLLDGGMQAWMRDHYAVTDKVPELEKASLAPLSIKTGLIVDGEWVKDHVGKPGIAVVDARAASFYDGADIGQDRKGRQRAGHIAGATSFPFIEVWSDDLKVKTVPELEALFAKAGVKPADTVVAYCHIGSQATGVLLAARLTGHPIMLYDGSFQDWSAHPSFPVETKATH